MGNHQKGNHKWEINNTIIEWEIVKREMTDGKSLSENQPEKMKILETL